MCWILFISRANKLLEVQTGQQYTAVRITQKTHLLIWNLETTENIYLYNYQTEAAIFLATKHEKTIMACSSLIFFKNIFFVLNF